MVSVSEQVFTRSRCEKLFTGGGARVGELRKRRRRSQASWEQRGQIQLKQATAQMKLSLRSAPSNQRPSTVPGSVNPIGGCPRLTRPSKLPGRVAPIGAAPLPSKSSIKLPVRVNHIKSRSSDKHVAPPALIQTWHNKTHSRIKKAPEQPGLSKPPVHAMRCAIAKKKRTAKRYRHSTETRSEFVGPALEFVGSVIE